MAEIFRADYKVTIGDINYGNHLGNDRALIVFQDGRVQMLQELGYSERDIGDDTGIIMVESGVRYLREIFLHEMLQVQITVSEIKAKKFTLDYSVRRGEEHVLTGFTAFLAFNYIDRKVARIPQDFTNRIGIYCSAE